LIEDYVANSSSTAPEPAIESKNYLLRNTSTPGALSFDIVTQLNGDSTDPNPNAPEDGFGLSFTSEPNSLKPGTNPGPWEIDQANTAFATASMCAVAGDFNRDGKIDVFIANHPQQNLGVNGQMDALYLNGGKRSSFPSGPASPFNYGLPGDTIFFDVTYDRRRFPFPGPFDPLFQPLPNIDWDQYLPVYGYQDAEDSFLFPKSRPVYRFSSSIAAIVTDLNNDLWPDLIVTNKGQITNNPLGEPTPPPGWGDLMMIYINRGNNDQGQWLGFVNRSWDLFLQQKVGQKDYKDPMAAMGITVGDFDRDGDFDFLVTDGSSPQTNVIEMKDDFYLNETGPGDLDFIRDDNGTGNQTNAESDGLHGDFILPCWFSWGCLMLDMDNDADLDMYVCSKRGILPETPLTLPIWAKETRAWDRLFLNQISQFPLNPPKDLFLDVNPSITNTQATFSRDTMERFDETRTVVSGDLDHDGWLDLVVLPSVGAQNWTTELWHNVSKNLTPTENGPKLDDTNASLTLFLKNPPSGQPGHHPGINTFAVGTRVRVQADMNGDGALDMGKQLAEVRIGEGNAGSTSSLPLEFGLGRTGLDPPDPNTGLKLSPNVVVEITWPCGHKQTEDFTVASGSDSFVTVNPDETQPDFQNNPNHTAEITSVSFFVAGSAEGSGLTPVVVKATPQTLKVAEHVELSLRKYDPANPGTFRPISMDYSPNAQGIYRLKVTPLLLASDATGFIPNDKTAYEVAVRGSDRFGKALSAFSIGDPDNNPDQFVVVQPETITGASSGWTFGGLGGAINQTILLPPGASASIVLEFPGWTDDVEYYIAPHALKGPYGNGNPELTVSCPDFSWNDMVTVDSATFKTFGLNSALKVPPTDEVQASVVFTNTGASDAPTISLDWFLLARKTPGLMSKNWNQY